MTASETAVPRPTLDTGTEPAERRQGGARRALVYLILATMLLPGEVTMVPVCLIWRKLDLINTLFPIWVSNLFGSAFYIVLIRQFYLTIPNGLKEAALRDVASHFRVLKYTLAVGVASFLKQPGLESRWDLWMAGSMMMTLPTIIFLFLAQKQFIAGIAAGAVKG